MEQLADLKDATDEELDAFVQLVVLVAYADGDLSEDEEKLLLESVRGLAGDRADDDRLKELMVELPPLSRSSSNWRADRISDLKKHLSKPELRNEVFRVAVDVARSDDRIGFREGRMLVNIVSELDIDNSFAQEVLKKGS
jgi:tellurite resistance protein